LRDEGEAYAAALVRAGAQAALVRKEGLIHGFINMIDVSPYARAAVKDMADRTSELFAEVRTKQNGTSNMS